MSEFVAQHPVVARIARHALRSIVVAAASGVIELLASALIHGQPIPDIRTLEAAALGPALLGAGRVLAEIDSALAAADEPPPSAMRP